MQLLVEQNPTLFLQKYSEFIHKDIIGNNLLDGLLNEAIGNKNDVYCFSVEKVDGEVMMLAMQVPPNSLVFSMADNFDAVSFFAKEFCKFDVPVTSCFGPKAELDKFLSIHNSVFKDAQLTKYTDDVLYSINGGINIEYVEQGELTFAKKKDVPLLAEWKNEFNKEILDKRQQQDEDESEALIRSKIDKQAVANLEVDDNIVASVIFDRADDIARFKFVYTPLEYRGKGYAKELIIKLTNYLFEEGFKVCCLITSETNKGANALYESAGYVTREGFAYYIPKD